ncbi:EGF-like domain [Popillia japonica]|uniref:EGF-like domain n=1 Tax=Popillia japonica TaxID=7064 RepID=A0AAW1MLM6_POPJA
MATELRELSTLCKNTSDKGRRRSRNTYRHKSPPPWTTLALVIASTSLFSIVDACSSRTTPKPRPPAPTARPNITFLTYECPPAYAAWYCLNGATCFTVKIADSLLYNCECAEGYMGPRCEYKDLDRSYLPSQQRIMLETASIAGGATIAILLVFILCFVVYIHYKRKSKQSRASTDCVDSPSITLICRPTFGTRWRNPPQVDLPIPHDRGDSKQNKIELHQVTTITQCTNNRDM